MSGSSQGMNGRGVPQLPPRRVPALPLDMAPQRRLSERATFAHDPSAPSQQPPAQQVAGSVVVAPPARADVEALDRQRNARREEASAAATARARSTSPSTTPAPRLSRHTSTLSVRRLSLPSTTSASSPLLRPNAQHTPRHKLGTGQDASHSSHHHHHQINPLRVVRTGSSFTVNSIASIGEASQRSTSVVSRHSAAKQKKARRTSSIAAFDDSDLDIDACRTMLEEAIQEGIEATQHSALQLSEDTFQQMQHNLARAVVSLDKKRFTALLGLCRDVCSALRFTTISSYDDNDSAQADRSRSAARLVGILDSVIDHSTGYTIMHLVVLANKTSLTHAALRYGSAVHRVEDVEGETALMLAMRRAPESVRVMMTLGKAVDVHRPLRMLVGQTHRPLAAKMLDTTDLVRRWAALAKKQATGEKEVSARIDKEDGAADGTSAVGTALVLSHRNLLHAAVMADEATPLWPGRVQLIQHLIEQHGLDAAQQDIFGFTPALLAREHAQFLGTSKDLQNLLRTIKAASVVQQLANAAAVGNGHSDDDDDDGANANDRGALTHEETKPVSTTWRKSGTGAGCDDEKRPFISRLASFALSVRSTTLLSGIEAEEEEVPSQGRARAASPQRRRASTISHRDLPLAQLAASLVNLGETDAAPAPSVLSASHLSSASDEEPLELRSDGDLRHAGLAVPLASGPQRPHYEVVVGSRGCTPERRAGTGQSNDEHPHTPSPFVKLRLVKPSGASGTATAACPAKATPTGGAAHSALVTSTAAPRLSRYIFPHSDDDENGADRPPTVPAAAAAVPRDVRSPLPDRPGGAHRQASSAPVGPVKDSRVFVSRSPPAMLTGSVPREAPTLLSPSPAGVRVDSASAGARSSSQPAGTLGRRAVSPSPGIPLVIAEHKTDAHLGTARDASVTAVLPSRLRVRVAALSAALSKALRVDLVDRRRWWYIGPYSRLACLVLALVLHCVSYALDVSCAYFRQVRFGLWCRALNILLGDTWVGSAFFMGLTHALCLIIGAVLGVVIVVHLLGRLGGCALLKLPCMGARDVSEMPYLERTFGLFVASFYKPHTRPRLFLLPLGLLLGLYSAALVYNTLVRALWPGQAWWAQIAPFMSTYSTYYTHFLILWATHIAVNWLLVCFVADLCYQHGVLGVFLPHFLFDRWASWLEVTMYPWCRQWGLLWPVQASCRRGRSVVAAAASRARAVREPARRENEPPQPPCVLLEEVHKAPVSTESFRLWLFWAALLVGWAVTALIFLLVGLLRVDSARGAWFTQLGPTPSRRPPLGATVSVDLITATSPFSAVRACLSILFASCALAVLCVAALQEWSWPVLLPHWHLSVPGLTMTGVHLGWLLWWWLFVAATFDGRQMIENMRALVHRRGVKIHNNDGSSSSSSRTAGRAGVVCGALALTPAVGGVCLLLVCIGRTSLWRHEKRKRADGAAFVGDDAGVQHAESKAALSKSVDSTTQTTSSDTTLGTSTSLHKSRGETVEDDLANREAAARGEDAQRVWICRADTLLERECVPPLFGVLHYLLPDLPQWRTLLGTRDASSPSHSLSTSFSLPGCWKGRRATRCGPQTGGVSAQDAVDVRCTVAESALQLLDAAVEALAHGARRADDVAAHDRRLLALLVQCCTDDNDDLDAVDEDGEDEAGGCGCAPHLTLQKAFQRRRAHHARKRRECLNELMAYAGSSTGATALATLGSRGAVGGSRQLSQGQSKASSCEGALCSGARPTRETAAGAASRSRRSASSRTAIGDRLHRRQEEVDFLLDIARARDRGVSSSPSPARPPR